MIVWSLRLPKYPTEIPWETKVLPPTVHNYLQNFVSPFSRSAPSSCQDKGQQLTKQLTLQSTRPPQTISTKYGGVELFRSELQDNHHMCRDEWTITSGWALIIARIRRRVGELSKHGFNQPELGHVCGVGA